MHERTIQHFCADAIDQKMYEERYKNADRDLPLFTTFLLNKRNDGTMRFMMKVALYKQQYEKGFLVFWDHMESLPLWSDSLNVQLNTTPAGDYSPVYAWNSENLTPSKKMISSPGSTTDQAELFVPLPSAGNVKVLLGENAGVRFLTSKWT